MFCSKLIKEQIKRMEAHLSICRNLLGNEENETEHNQQEFCLKLPEPSEPSASTSNEARNLLEILRDNQTAKFKRTLEHDEKSSIIILKKKDCWNG